MINVYMNRFGEQFETVTTQTLLARKSARAEGLMKPPSYLVRSCCPRRPAAGWHLSEMVRPSEELTDRLEARPALGQGLWSSGGDIERDNIAVIEVMTDELDLPYWKTPPEA